MVVYAVIAIAGAGDCAELGGSDVRSASPALLFSLGTALLNGFALLSLSPLTTAATPFASSPLDSTVCCGFWVCQLDRPQTTPVKLFSWNGLRSHLRHGVPLRSSARRPALMAPWLALGPSLWLGGMSFDVSSALSSLQSMSAIRT